MTENIGEVREFALRLHADWIRRADEAMRSGLMSPEETADYLRMRSEQDA